MRELMRVTFWDQKVTKKSPRLHRPARRAGYPAVHI